jgi:hypothetical protein
MIQTQIGCQGERSKEGLRENYKSILSNKKGLELRNTVLNIDLPMNK